MWGIFWIFAGLAFSIVVLPTATGFVWGLWQERGRIKRIRRANRQEGKSQEYWREQSIERYEWGIDLQERRQPVDRFNPLEAALQEEALRRALISQQAALGQAHSTGLYGFATLGSQAARNHQAGLGLGIFGGKGGV